MRTKRKSKQEEKLEKARKATSVLESAEVRRRLRSKQSVEAKGITEEVKSKPMGLDFTLEFPLKVEWKKGSDKVGNRHKPHSIIIDTFKRHVVGCSSSVCAGHFEVLTTLANEAAAQGVKTRKQVAESLARRVEEYNATNTPDSASALANCSEAA